MKKIFRVFFILSIVYGCQHSDQPKVIIASSSNMQYAIKEMATSFTKETGIKCEIVLGSSGKLMAQITNNAPYDIFISADSKYPNTLYKNNKALYPPKTYAYGTLVLWSNHPDISPSLKILSSDDVNHIAIANPKTAPYGIAAMNVLNDFGLYEKTKHKLVYGESISQVNQFINTGSTEIGFTAKSVVLSLSLKNKGKWVAVPQNSYSPITQSAIIIKHNKVSPQTIQFYDFLFSKQAEQILENFGYLVPEKS